MAVEKLRPVNRLARRCAWEARQFLRLTALAGSAVNCPVCDRSFRRFVTHRGRPDAKCPACGALERHRLLWGFVAKRTDVASRGRILHFAPEAGIRRRLTKHFDGQYVAVDMRPQHDVALDIASLPFRNDSFDFIVCCHVLEHIRDDTHAMEEIARVLSPTGHAVIQVPQDMTMAGTDEIPDLTPRERALRYGQEDHLRLYGRDIVDRLTRAGMRVDEVTTSSFGADAVARWRIPADQALFHCVLA